MGLYNTFPIVFDETQILSPSQWEETSDVIEEINTTEAGTDNIEVTRYDKLTVSARFKVAESQTGGEWAKTFKTFSKKPSISVKRYDIMTQAYDTRTMRMRDFSAVLVSKSDLLSGVNGVWEISFKLIEF